MSIYRVPSPRIVERSPADCLRFASDGCVLCLIGAASFCWAGVLAFLCFAAMSTAGLIGGAQ